MSDFANASHSHVQSDVTGLSAALAGKAPLSHYHAMSNVTGLASALSGKAASSHSHVMDDVTGLSDALAGKITDPGGTKTSGYVLTVDGTSLAWQPTGSGTDGNAVHYTADAGKTDAQKAQARANMGAASASDVSAKRDRSDLDVEFCDWKRSGGNYKHAYGKTWILHEDYPADYVLSYSDGTWNVEVRGFGPDAGFHGSVSGSEDALTLEIPVFQYGEPEGTWIFRRPAVSSRLAVEAQLPASEQMEAWTAKQDALTFDGTPTAGSENPVKSGGVKSALDAKQGKISLTAGSIVKCTGDGTVAAAAASDVPGLGDVRGKTDLDVYSAVISPWTCGQRQLAYSSDYGAWYGDGSLALGFYSGGRWLFTDYDGNKYPALTGKTGHELTLTFTKAGFPGVTVTRQSESVPGPSTGDTLAKSSELPTKSSLGLGNVDNTSDASKPVSTATQAALNDKQDKSNLVTSFSSGVDDVHYPSAKLVKDSLDAKVSDPAGKSAGKVLTVGSGGSALQWSDPHEPAVYVKSITETSRALAWLDQDGKVRRVDLGMTTEALKTSWQQTPDDSHIPTEKLVKDSIDAVNGRFAKDVLPSGASEWSEYTDYNIGDTCWLDSAVWMAKYPTGPGAISPGPGPVSPSASTSSYWKKVERPSDFAVLRYGQSKIVASDPYLSSTFLSLENDLLKIRDADDGTTGSYNELSMKVYPNAVYFKAYCKNGSAVNSATLDKAGVHTVSSNYAANSETEVTYGPDGVKVETYSVSNGVRAASAAQSTTAFSVTHDGVELSSVILKDTGAGRSNDKYRLSVVNGELTIAKV